jgi:hypothetical protein
MATIYIAAVHLSGGTQHEHISQLVWMNGSTFGSGIISRAGMVEFIDDKKGDVRASDGKTVAQVGVVHPNVGSAYLRTHKDGKWTDNLLALPQY